MRRLIAIVTTVGLVLVPASIGDAQVDDETVQFPDGEWVGRFQTSTVTPTGSAMTVVEFTLQTSDGAGVDGAVTGYTATTQNRETDGEFEAVATSTVIDHDFGLDSGSIPPSFSGTATWKSDVRSTSRIGERHTDLPNETLPATWPMVPRAVSCTSVSSRTGGTQESGRFRTEMVAFREGGDESDIVTAFVALLGVIEADLAEGELSPIEAAQHVITAVALLRDHNEELSALDECQLAIPGLGELDPLRALLEPLLQQLLSIVRDGEPDVMPIQQLLKVLSAAFEAGALGPLAINQPVAEQLEAAFRDVVLPIAISWAKDNNDVVSLIDTQLVAAMHGWSSVVAAAEMALQEILSPPATKP